MRSLLRFALYGTPQCVALGASKDWPAYGGDAANTKYSTLTQIDAGNVARLRVAWRWRSPDNDISRANPGLHLNLFEGTPVVTANGLYVVTGFHVVSRLDPATGTAKWTFNPEIYQRGMPQRLGFVHRGVAVWPVDGRVLVGNGEGFLYALDAETGNPIEGFGERGRVDLLVGLRGPAKRFEFGVNSLPIVVGDVVVIGNFVQDGWLLKGAPPGDVRGYDARTGKLLWSFHVIPEGAEPGVETWENNSWKEAGSANVWTYMAADEKLGLVYLPTSTPVNDHYGGHRLGDNLFAESVVALEAKTGRRVWHFQTTHHGVWDYDLPAGPILADVTIAGQRRSILAQVSKQAFLYVLDRQTGKPIWPIDERPVPASSAPGERLAATQPFPTRPAAFDRQGITKEELIDFTPELRAEAEKIVSQYDHGPLYSAPSERGVICLPGQVGGASWAGAALDPDTGMLYVPSVTNPFVVRLAANSGSNMRFLGLDRFRLEGPGGLPLTKPPYGRLTAIDLNTGDHRWMIPLGAGPKDHARLKGLDLPDLGWASRNFALVTKTLLFTANEPAIASTFVTQTNTLNYTARTRDPALRAFDKATGREIAKIPLPANAGGSPAIYEHGGRQFIVVPAGGGGVEAELVALALGDPSSR